MRKLINPALGIVLFLASSLGATGGGSPARRPLLLHFVGSDSLTADLLVAGTKNEPVYFFRDPHGLRLRIEKKGDWDHGFTQSFNYVGGGGGYVQIQDFYVFRTQGLPYMPIIVTINGKTIAGYLDNGVETKRLGKKVYAEYKKLPSNFQRALYNLCIFGENLHGENLDPGADDASRNVGVLLSEDWNSPGLPDYKAEVLVADPNDENAVPNFQRLFSE